MQCMLQELKGLVKASNHLKYDKFLNFQIRFINIEWMILSTWIICFVIISR